MVRKRGNGEGSIHKRENGTWQVQLTLEGKRISRTFKTQRECQEWLKKAHNQVDNGMTYASTKVTLGDYLIGWLSSNQTSFSRSTCRHYKLLIYRHINPRIGEIKLRDLRPEYIQVFYNDLYNSKVGIPTIRKAHIVLHSALQHAVRSSMISNNPASLARPPKQPATEMAILNDSQISQLLITAQGHRWEAPFHLAVISGMRQMELLGLKWSDLDWVKQTLKVERQLERPDGEGVKFSAPKTRYGKRSITLGSKTIELLHGHYQQQQEDRLAAGEKWQEHNLIFTTGNGTPIHPRNLLRTFKQLLCEAGLPPIRFHDLRHTAASLLLNQGVPAITVSRRLGHAKASITLDIYGHLIPSMQNDLGDRIDEWVMPIAVQLDQTVEPGS